MKNPVYADETDVPTPWPDSWDDPGTASAWLRMASLLVRLATKAAVYATDSDGRPADPDIAQAFKDATVAQVRFWIDNDLDPLTGAGSVRGTGETEESAIGSGRVRKATANTTVVSERLASLSTLVPSASAHLSGLPGEVWVRW